MQAEMVENRRWLHAHAETGFELPQTVGFIKKKLTETGCVPLDCGRAGVVTVIGKGDRAFLLRADTDALPIAEKSGLSFACKTGNMHACGHDMHTAILLGAAKLLKARERELRGAVKLLFQPAEERLEGAKDTIEAGVLQEPEVGAAMMLHVMTDTPMESGRIVVSSAGVSAPAADYFQIRVRGKSCHGSAPQNGVDALLIAAHILVALQELSAREIPASSPVVLTVGSLYAGTGGNIIADTALAEGTLRAFDEELRAKIKARMGELVRGVARALQGRARLRFTSGCPALLNDEHVCAFAERELKELFGEKEIFSSEQFSGRARGMGGSEDFAYISREVPSVMIALCAGERGKGYRYPLHHPKVKFDESALYIGAAALARCALAWKGK